MEESDEEIAMVPLASPVGTVLRVERQYSKSRCEQDRSIQHAGNGIVIKKPVKVRPYRGPSDATRRFTAYVCSAGQTVKEAREIRFWVKDAYVTEIDNVATEFFKKLIQPTNFPKDHLSYVKRILQLVRQYKQLRFVEVEIRPYESKDRYVDVNGQAVEKAEAKVRLKKMTSFVDVRKDRSVSASDLRSSNRKSLGRRNRDSSTEVPAIFIDLYKREDINTEIMHKISTTNDKNKSLENIENNLVDGGNFDNASINEDHLTAQQEIVCHAAETCDFTNKRMKKKRTKNKSKSPSCSAVNSYYSAQNFDSSESEIKNAKLFVKKNSNISLKVSANRLFVESDDARKILKSEDVAERDEKLCNLEDNVFVDNAVNPTTTNVKRKSSKKAKKFEATTENSEEKNSDANNVVNNIITLSESVPSKNIKVNMHNSEKKLSKSNKNEISSEDFNQNINSSFDDEQFIIRPAHQTSTPNPTLQKNVKGDNEDSIKKKRNKDKILEKNDNNEMTSSGKDLKNSKKLKNKLEATKNNVPTSSNLTAKLLQDKNHEKSISSSNLTDKKIYHLNSASPEEINPLNMSANINNNNNILPEENKILIPRQRKLTYNTEETSGSYIEITTSLTEDTNGIIVKESQDLDNNIIEKQSKIVARKFKNLSTANTDRILHNESKDLGNNEIKKQSKISSIKLKKLSTADTTSTDLEKTKLFKQSITVETKGDSFPVTGTNETNIASSTGPADNGLSKDQAPIFTEKPSEQKSKIPKSIKLTKVRTEYISAKVVENMLLSPTDQTVINNAEVTVNKCAKKKEKSTDCDSALIPLICVHG